MSNRAFLTVVLACACAATAHAETSKPFDASAAFGARPSVSNLHLSPDGMSVVYIAPIEGQGSIAVTLSLTKGAIEKPALRADGKPNRLENCRWVSNDRLVCSIYAVINDPVYGSTRMSRLVAVDADGKNLKLLSTRENYYTHGVQLRGGDVIDWLP